MNKGEIKQYLADLRHLTIFPRRYGTPQGKPFSYWTDVAVRYGNVQKEIKSSDWHWRVIKYTDGREELAYLRVLKDGLFSGMYSAIYRGLIIPRRIELGTFSHIESIRLAF